MMNSQEPSDCLRATSTLWPFSSSGPSGPVPVRCQSAVHRVVSLDLEATRAESRAAQAKAEAERWEADAEAKKVQSKARISVIDLVEDMLAQGIKGDDFISWATIIEKAGLSVEELAESLEEYSTIQALSADRQRQAEEIRTEIRGLEAQVLALAQEWDSAHSAIEAVRDKALKTVRAAESPVWQYWGISGNPLQYTGKNQI